MDIRSSICFCQCPHSAVEGRLVPSRYLRVLSYVLWGEKIGYEDGLRRAGCHGKRRRKNKDRGVKCTKCVD